MSAYEPGSFYRRHNDHLLRRLELPDERRTHTIIAVAFLAATTALSLAWWAL
jgi:hypothetical protein